jgi:oxaloacetate decarboxylase gamma subunit
MILLIGLAARLTKDVTARELQAIEAEKQRLKREREMAKQAATPDDDIDIVVITAAIAAFEAERAAA